MNDTELVTAMREPFRPVQLAAPVDSIMARGSALRRRRRRLSAIGGGAAASASSAALAVSLLLAGGSPASAWTVTRKPDGAIAVTIRQLNQPNALIRELRRDGVRASFDGPPYTTRNAIDWACLRPMSPALHRAFSVRKSPDPHAAAFLLRPSVIPAGDTLSIYWAEYSPTGFRHHKVSPAGGSMLISRPGGRKVRKSFTIPLTVSGDFAFQAAFVNPAGRCVR